MLCYVLRCVKGIHCFQTSYLITGICCCAATALTFLLTPRTEYGKKTPAELKALEVAQAAATASYADDAQQH